MTAIRRGLTLIELIAVAAIMAMVAGTLAVAVRGSAEGAEWHRAIGDVRHLDSMARIRARTDGPALVSLAADGRSVRASVQASDESIALATVPAGIAIAIRAPGGGTMTALAIDGAGRSESVSYVLRGARRAVRIPVNGQAGQHGETVEETP